MRFAFCIVLLTLCPLAFGIACPKDQPKDGTALLQLERIWAKALEVKDADAVACILANEFEDADVYGNLHSRGEALARVAQRKPSHNQLSEMSPHVLGDSAFVRGLNTVTDPKGNSVAKVRFTDIFVYRDGRWQAVAAQETLLTESSK
ncbi:MAG TPA: nuclear transport factor 2 family protein [Terriglobales bacterium]|nr:nuclear transport factor 2 family protein [Terriglobales bacterium]